MEDLLRELDQNLGGKLSLVQALLAQIEWYKRETGTDPALNITPEINAMVAPLNTIRGLVWDIQKKMADAAATQF